MLCEFYVLVYCAHYIVGIVNFNTRANVMAHVSYETALSIKLAFVY